MNRRPTYLIAGLVAAAFVAGCNGSSEEQSPRAHGAKEHAESTAVSSGEHGHGLDHHDAERAGSDSPTEHAEDEGHAHDDNHRVHLSADQRATLALEIGRAEPGRAGAVIEAPATLRFDADRVARVGPRLQAKVVEVNVDLGTPVEQGDALAVLDSVTLGKEKAAYLTAAARFRTRQAAYARDRKLAADQIVSESDLAETRAAYEQARAERQAERAELKLYGLSDREIDAIDHSGDTPLSRLTLQSPRAGVVAKRELVAGQTLDANETPIHVVDTSRLWLMIDAAEQALPQLGTGQTVEFGVRPLPDRRFTGEIDWISPQLDAQARTVRVRAIVDNPDGVLRAGMFATARIATPTDRAEEDTVHHALVPVDAVQQVDDREGVFVPAEEEGAFVFREVRTGAERDGLVELTRGLAPGGAVVVRGAFDLKAAMTASGRSAAHSH